jgi:transcriptional regulator with XRE-family HTH domain
MPKFINRNTTLWKAVKDARKKKKITLQKAAALICKEDGIPITHQYLSEIENNRRQPSPHIVKEIAAALDVPVEFLFFHAEIFPPGTNKTASEETVVAAYRDFVKRLEGKLENLD